MEERQKRAVIYCRVSTQEQTQRDALAVQVQEAQNAVKSNEWVLVDQYIEMESGTTKHGRSEYMRLLDDIKDKNKFDIIVIKSLDRLNRSAKNWYLFVEELVNNDKLLYIYMDRAFYKTDDRLISGVKAILAEQYSRDLSSKINNAHEYRQKNGTTVLINNNTYGYVKNPDKSVSIHPEEAEMIRKIYRLAAQGCGSRTISKILYQDGIRNRNGNQLEESSIRRIIKNPLFKGVVVMNKRHFDFERKKEIKNPESEWIYHQGLVPAIVEEELWEKANKMLKLSAAQVKGAGRQKKHRELYDFSGKLICGECGTPYYKTFRRQYANPEHVIVEWRCSSYLKHGRKKQEVAEGTNQSKEWGADEQELRRGQITGCDNIHLKQEGLERMMRELSGQLFAWQDEENMIRRIIKILSEVLLTGETHLKKEEVEKNLMAVRNRKSRLLDLLLDNTISKQGYKSKQKELEQEEQRWTERLERMDVEEEKIRQTKERLVGIEQKLRADGCEKIQAGLLMQVMDHIRVFEDRLEIELNPVALPGVASVHGWIMQKPGALQKDYLQEYLIEVPTARYFSDTRIIKKKKKESIPDILRKEPFLTNKELAKRLDVTFSTLRRWLADYKKKGQIYFDKTGGKGQWRVRE
ncbi:MAG: recombinase family protein [Clostridiales bacterium]|nr:recombinase family protein [Clostridiales bacterium]